MTPLKEEDAYPAQPQDAFGWEKMISERLCMHYREEYGMGTRIVRFHNIFGSLGTWDGGREKGLAQNCARSETIMGEARVKIKLTNAVDQALVRRGLMKPDGVRVYEADALVDTGAVRCVLPPHVVERLGLNHIGMRTAEYADGRLESVPLTEPFVLEVAGREEMENAMVLGDEVLVGQTALEKLDLMVDCVNQRLVANPAHPDQPVSKVKHLH